MHFFHEDCGQKGDFLSLALSPPLPPKSLEKKGRVLYQLNSKDINQETRCWDCHECQGKGAPDFHLDFYYRISYVLYKSVLLPTLIEKKRAFLPTLFQQLLKQGLNCRIGSLNLFICLHLYAALSLPLIASSRFTDENTI